jgi:hypothetical protein
VSKIDKTKEEIGFLKLIIAIVVAIEVSLLAWLVQNYARADIVLLILCCVAIVVATGIIIWASRVAFGKIDELENL